MTLTIKLDEALSNDISSGGTCVRGACVRGVCIGGTCIQGIFIRGTCIGSINAIERLEILSRLSQILEVRPFGTSWWSLSLY